MATLASYANKTDFTGPDVTIPADGPVQFLVHGRVSTYGRVMLQIKHGSEYQTYPELATYGFATALQAELKTNDIVRVVFEKCADAFAEVRQ